MNFKKEDSKIVLIFFLLTIKNIYPREIIKLQYKVLTYVYYIQNFDFKMLNTM